MCNIYDGFSDMITTDIPTTDNSNNLSYFNESNRHKIVPVADSDSDKLFYAGRVNKICPKTISEGGRNYNEFGSASIDNMIE